MMLGIGMGLRIRTLLLTDFLFYTGHFGHLKKELVRVIASIADRDDGDIIMQSLHALKQSAFRQGFDRGFAQGWQACEMSDALHRLFDDV